MKTNTTKRLLLVSIILVSLAACQKDLEPYNAKSDESALSTPADLQTATYGAYAGLVNADYTLNLYWMSQYPDDDVALSGTTTNTLYNNYTYTHFQGMVNTKAFWRQSYKVIYSANRIIEKIKDGTSPALDQLKGENLYLRAMAHFNLVRFFGRPYPQGQGQNPGIVIKDNTLNDQPVRKTVKEVYDFVITDLLNAATLMNGNKNSCFASKEVAYALLSRIYLYKEDNANAILYANKVLTSNRYKLLDTEPYKKYFTAVPESNTETIFAIRHTQADNRFKSAIGNQFYNDPITKSTGYGESYASQVLVDLVDQNPQDVRHSFIEPQRDANGMMLTRGNTPKYYINKFNWQEGVANLSSPVYLRLAEMYLTRAEANAKLGNYQLALDDVNLIRRRSGLTGTALYTLADLKGRESVLDVVLEERRLELFLEGHRYFDLFRNNKPMVRAYIGFHGTDRFNFTVLPTSTRVVYFIPEDEIIVNPNLKQNP